MCPCQRVVVALPGLLVDVGGLPDALVGDRLTLQGGEHPQGAQQAGRVAPLVAGPLGPPSLASPAKVIGRISTRTARPVSGKVGP